MFLQPPILFFAHKLQPGEGCKAVVLGVDRVVKFKCPSNLFDVPTVGQCRFYARFGGERQNSPFVRCQARDLFEVNLRVPTHWGTFIFAMMRCHIALTVSRRT